MLALLALAVMGKVLILLQVILILFQVVLKEQLRAVTLLALAMFLAAVELAAIPGTQCTKQLYIVLVL